MAAKYFLFICETHDAKSFNRTRKPSAPQTHREHQRHGLLILILRTKARRWSDQPRSKHALFQLALHFGECGPDAARPVPRLFLSQFPKKRSDVAVLDHVSRSFRETAERIDAPCPTVGLLWRWAGRKDSLSTRNAKKSNERLLVPQKEQTTSGFAGHRPSY